MKRRCFSFGASAALVFTLAFMSPAQTPVLRTFVASHGSDANPCSRTQPCRTFQRAHDVVQALGEVMALDSDNFGRLNITKSVTITGEGVHAVVDVETNTQIGITIGNAGTVKLRHLTIRYLTQPVGGLGILAKNFTALHVEDCNIDGFHTGISVDNLDWSREVYVDDTVITNNGYGVYVGHPDTSSVETAVTIERTRMHSNEHAGVYTIGKVKATVRGSIAAGGSIGFYVENKAQLNLEESVSCNNATGVFVSRGATARVSNSTVTNNRDHGLNNNSSTLESRRNNTVRGNGVNTVGTITYIAAQ
ncbi:MAG TPA: right-handed parallel beta-helix repeat-containing protein [Pyrinomonadaceae bacterium]|nr:right-handed parallel beta-helix repeat-containing protein [Pyrinomonadaceae bacterium]